MKIVILDGYTANPGDLSWEPLKKIGELTVYDRTRPEETVERAKDADIVLTNKVCLHRQEIEQLPQLKYIGVLGNIGRRVAEIAQAFGMKAVALTSKAEQELPFYVEKRKEARSRLIEVAINNTRRQRKLKTGKFLTLLPFFSYLCSRIENQTLVLSSLSQNHPQPKE